MSEDANRAELPPPDSNRFTALWQQTKDHRIAQWTVGYVAVAYGIQHAVTLTSEAFKWPDEIIRISMLLLALGLPVAMTLAWYHGERASRRVSAGEMSIVSLLLVLISFAFYSVVRPAPESAAVKATPVQEAGVTAARAVAANPRLGIAVAVMPFANLSGDKDQEYFSDGMTDEISGALAKIPDLSVVARSSAYEFKGKNQNARAIGQQLHATHLIEGSVRKAGDQLRISAELVNADDGVTVWSSSYDRQLKDVFAVQEDIARAIAASLHMTLGLKPGENLVNTRAVNPELHEAYLHAQALVKSRRSGSVDEAIHILEGVVARDPNYAPAWGLLGSAHHVRLLSEPTVLTGNIENARPIVADHLSKGRVAAEKAIQLDPKSAEGYLALAQMRNDTGNAIGSMQADEQALALDPDNPEALHNYSIRLAHAGFVKQALPIRDHLLAVEPFVPAFQTVTARLLFADGQTDRALAILENTRPALQIFEILAAAGRYREAADRMVGYFSGDFVQMRDPAFAAAVGTVVKLLRAAPAPAPPNSPDLGAFDWVYIHVGAPERFMGAYDKEVRMGFDSGGDHGAVWAPAYAAARKTERFRNYMRDIGIVAYWRAKGWPPQCHPTTGDDFECN